jgi:signal transduction histidine kinase
MAMHTSEMEPGFLQVFRIYAWLRAFSLLFIPTLQFHNPLNFPLSNLYLPGALALIDITFLLVYLYWKIFPESLGKAYVPIALAFATLAIMVEQHLFSGYRGNWQLEPFIYILLILTAWQYDFRAVILFTFLSAGLQIGLNIFLPQPDPFLRYLPPSPDFQHLFTFGFLASRSMTFLVLGYVVTRLVKAQRRQRQELAQTNRQLMQHAATVEQLAISHERNRLSRELHDTLAHTLSALTVQLEALLTVWNPIPDKPNQMLHQMLATTRSGLDETRRALSALRAAPLEEMGLAIALRTLAEDFAMRHAWKLQMDIPPQVENVPEEVEQSFYRIAQETLENIARHANAHSIRVSLTDTHGTLTLKIADDGRGFDPNTVSEEQLGLKGMHERADLIGASFVVKSQPGQGTTIEVSLEVPQ